MTVRIRNIECYSFQLRGVSEMLPLGHIKSDTLVIPGVRQPDVFFF